MKYDHNADDWFFNPRNTKIFGYIICAIFFVFMFFEDTLVSFLTDENGPPPVAILWPLLMPIGAIFVSLGKLHARINHLEKEQSNVR
jgi:lipopolysaccharide export LptBFGC system permease protein LptF